MKKEAGLVMKLFCLERIKFLRDVNELAKEFHSCFISIVSSLDTTEKKCTIQKSIPSSKPIDKVL